MSDAAVPPEAGEAPELENERDARRVWVCATCEEQVADPEAALSIGGRPAVSRFANPAGYVWEIVTVSEARSLVVASTPQTAFSWFAGYAWRIVVCARCHTHLGWRYDAVSGASPPRFHGLILAHLKLA